MCETDETTLIGLISHRDESDFRWKADNLVTWCWLHQVTRLSAFHLKWNQELNALKTVVVDFRKNPAPLNPITLCDSPVNTVESRALSSYGTLKGN